MCMKLLHYGIKMEKEEKNKFPLTSLDVCFSAMVYDRGGKDS